MFFIKNKPVIVNCYHTNNRYCSEVPIKSAISAMKSRWYQSVDKSQKSHSIHGCAGFRDLLSNSFSVSTPFDLELSIHKSPNNDGFSINSDHPDTTQSFRGTQFLSMHNGDQLGNLCKEKDMSIFKMALPFTLDCSEGIEFMVSPNIWADNGMFEEILYTSGVINFKYQHFLNIFFMLKHKENVLNIPYGSNVVLLTPLTERKVIFNHIYSVEKYDQFSSDAGSKFRSYFKKKTFIDKA